MLNTYKFFDVSTIAQYKIYKYINEYFEELEVDIEWKNTNEANV